MPAQRETQNPAGVSKKKKKPVVPPVIAAVTESAKATTQSIKEGKPKAAPIDLGVTTTADREEASKSTQKSSTKKDRKDFHKAERQAKAFRGTLKNPRTKAEKKAEAQGKAVERILYDKKDVTPNNNLSDIKPDVLRTIQLDSLREHKKEVEKKLNKTPGEFREGGVELSQRKNLEADLAKTQLNITRLKKDQVSDTIREIDQAEEKIAKKVGKPGYDQKKVVKLLVAQEQAVQGLEDKKTTLDRKHAQERQRSILLNKERVKRLKGTEDVLRTAAADPVNLGEEGIRQRGQYSDSQIKIPGVPGWMEFDAAQPSSALEDAAEMAAWFVPGGAIARAGKVALGSTALAKLAGKGSSALKGIVGASRPGLAAKNLGYIAKDLGYAATKKLPLGLRANAAVIASKAAITKASPRMIDAIKSQEGHVVLNTGSALEKAKPVMDTVHARAYQSLLLDAVDQALINSAKRVVTSIPKDVKGWQSTGLHLGTRFGKGALVLGGATAIPQLAQGKSVEDTAGLIMRDAWDFVTGVVPSTYQIGAAGFEYLHGNEERYEMLKEQFLEHDPIGLAFQGRWEDAVDAYNERPFMSTLELAGIEYGVGRTVGATMRRLPFETSKRWAEIPNFESLGPVDTRAMSLGRHSPDVFRKGANLALDKAFGKIAPNASQKLKNLQNVERVHQKVDSLDATQKNTLIRMMQETTAEHVKLWHQAKAISHDHVAPNALPFMITRIARSPKTARADLVAYRKTLEQTFNRRKGSIKAEVKEANILTEETIRSIDEILDKGHILGDQRLWDIADEFVAKEATRQEALWQTSTLNPQQTRAASWIPYIVNHLGGKFEKGKGWVVKTQMRGPKGQFLPKNIDLWNHNHLDAVEAYAKSQGVASPGFFRLQGLNDELIPFGVETPSVTGRAAEYFNRTDQAIRNGTFDPTFNALYSHAMRVGHTVLDANYMMKLADEFSPFRRDAKTGQIYYHGTNKDAALGIGKEGFNTDSVFFTNSKGRAGKYSEVQISESGAALVESNLNLKNSVRVFEDKDGNNITQFPDGHTEKNIGPLGSGITSRKAKEDGYDAIVHETPKGDQDIEVFNKSIIEEAKPPEPVGKGATGEKAYMLLDTRKGIEEQIAKLPNPEDYVPFNVEAAKIRLSAVRGMGEEFGTQGARAKFNDNTASAIADAFEAGQQVTSDGVHYVAMPKAALQRQAGHALVDDKFYRQQGWKQIRRINRGFKGAVLPFNPHWGLGNAVDMTYRLMMDQSGGPAQWTYNWAKGRSRLKKLEKQNPQAYADLMEQMGHGFITESTQQLLEDRLISPSLKQNIKERFDIQRSMLGWQSDPATKANMINRSVRVAEGLGSWVGAFYRTLQNWNPAGFHLQRLIEKQVRTATFGKHDTQLLRDMQKGFSESVLITPEVMKDVTMRLENSNVQSALAERVNGVLGNYNSMSPAMRTAVMSYAPFALWFRASVNWVLTLPSKHPAQTALLAGINRMTEEDRRNFGLSVFSRVEKGEEAGELGLVPTRPLYQQGSLVLGDNLYPTNTLSSFGTLANPFAWANQFIAPQISSPFLAGLGLTWTGEEMIFPDGRSVKDSPFVPGIMLSQLAETFVPMLRLYKMVQAEGAPDETATIWDPKPEGLVSENPDEMEGLRDTYISQFPGGNAYEAAPRNPWAQFFNPFKVTPITPPDDSRRLPPPLYGDAAFSAGQAERERNIKSKAEGQGWLQGEREVEGLQQEGTIPKPSKPKVQKYWLQGK